MMFTAQMINEVRRFRLMRLMGLVIAKTLRQDTVRGRTLLDQMIFNDIHHDRRPAHHKEPFADLFL